MPNPKPADAAWSAIVQARGDVQGKSLHMSRGTLAAILWDRGERAPELTNRYLYGLPVVTLDWMTYGHVTLERRVW
jgi:hypothetical protein